MPVLVLAILLMSLSITGCSSAEESPVDDVGSGLGAESAPGRLSRDEFKPTIFLAVADWSGSKLNAAIAEQIIERRLGYPVEPTSIVDTGDMLEDLRTGELHAALEIWPSSLEPSEQELISEGAIEDLGDLGVTGKIGWFIPRLLVEENPELARWETLADPAIAAQFATDDSEGFGRFLGTDPNYEQNDEELIEALNLPFRVVYSGSESATAAEVEQSIAAADPVVLFWWTPTAEIVRFDLVEVALPERTPACEADIDSGGRQRCDYPQQPLFKIGWPELAEVAPEVHQFLQSFELTTDDQLQLLDQVENEGRPIDQVASQWIDVNMDRWSSWLD